MRIFISYSDADKNKMKALRKAFQKHLQNAEVIVVADQRSPLTPLSDKVRSGIDHSTHFIPILTRKSIHNQWVNQEIGYAQSRAKSLLALPIVESGIRGDLKGFIHSQMDLPFSFDGDAANARKEAGKFRRCYKSLIDHLSQTSTTSFLSDVFPASVRQGEPYETRVEFVGEIKNGFFDNLVRHEGSSWKQWNWDPESMPNTAPTTPGKLNGHVNVSRSYRYPTTGWPKGRYKIYVRLYSHLVPGEPGRQVVQEHEHDFEVT